MQKRDKETGAFSVTRIALIVGLFLSITTLLPMRSIDRELQAADGGFGIVSLELAFTTDRFGEILGDWGEDLIHQAIRSIHIDFGFIPGYTLVLWVITLSFIGRKGYDGSVIGKLLWMTPFAAGLFDIVENVLLLQVLQTGPGIESPLMFIASLMAAIKFGLILMLLLSWILLAFSKRKERQS